MRKTGSEKTIKMPSAMTSIKNNTLSHNQIKLLFLIAKTIQEKGKQPEYEIKMRKAKKFLKTQNYNYIYDNMKELQSLLLEFNSFGKDKKIDRLSICFLPTVRDYFGGKVTFQVHEYFLKMMFENHPFFRIEEIVLMEMKSKFSLIIYSIAKDCLYNKENIEIDIDLFKKVLGVDGKYERFTDFKIHIIDKAINEIESITPVKIEYELNKHKGLNKYKSIKLKPHIEYKLTPEEKQLVTKIKGAWKDMVNPEELLYRLIKKYGSKRVSEVFDYVHNQPDKKVKNKPGLFRNMLSEQQEIPKDKVMIGGAYSPDKPTAYRKETDGDLTRLKLSAQDCFSENIMTCKNKFNPGKKDKCYYCGLFERERNDYEYDKICRSLKGNQ